MTRAHRRSYDALGGGDMGEGREHFRGALSPTNQEVWDVVKDLELSLALVSIEDYVIVAATEGFLEAVGRDASDVIERPASDLFLPSEESSIRAALDALSKGKIEFYRTHRLLFVPHGDARRVSIWVHAINFGNERFALCQLSADGDAIDNPLLKYSGESAPAMAFGITDDQGMVTSVSEDIHDVMGVNVSDLVGKPLLRGPGMSNAWRLLDATPAQTGRNCISMRLNSLGPGAGAHVRCIVTSFVKSSNYGFILIPEAELATAPTNDRVADLEKSLWKIASEVQASGIFERLGSFPDARRFPQLSTLSSRQWDVLIRLLRGQRVSTIAEALFVSESTVRNSLSSIFHKFGVHSQAELLNLLLDDASPTR
ncbi:MAG: Response regulator containing a CheY-like receiver domain and an DNA-binding domain [Acidimicrobiaceae bacterium]|nr:Response regulator containing a CheY-like receiver domain and an DNA-binding domain [Acidimicrobiaceae bacterium]